MITNNDSHTQDLLIELGTEELPPKSLKKLQQSFHHSVCAGLRKLNLGFVDPGLALASPRRLAIQLHDVDNKQPDQKVESLGPSVAAAFDAEGNATKASLGFAKKVGVDVSELTQIDTDKGPRLAFQQAKKGQSTLELIPSIVEAALADLPIPKRMRWGASRREFIRPTHWMLVIYGDQSPEVDMMGLQVSNRTYGHRFHANHSIEIKNVRSYTTQLMDEGKVLVDLNERSELIRSQVEAIAANELNGVASISDDLLEEVTALVEWPVALAGEFDSAFLDIPPEALISSMKEHQKYFHIHDHNGKLLPAFITVSNIESSAPDSVIQGNERVIRPRLADAEFFYRADKALVLEEFRDKLKPLIFQAKLGSVFEKSERVAKLAQGIAVKINGDPVAAKRAGELCKCDLVSNMVLEFGDLQGIMGRYYALHSGEPEEVAEAIFEHYLPRHSGDQLPATKTGAAVALADRLDTLTGIFSIGQIPSGSKDPFALRRASLGVLRILVENSWSFSLDQLIAESLSLHHSQDTNPDETAIKLKNYVLDRFSAWFSDLGISTESFLAVSALDPDDPFDIYQRVLAVDAFAKSDAASSLAAANKRVANILAKQDQAISQKVNSGKFQQKEESELWTLLSKTIDKLTPLIEERKFEAALTALSVLRHPVDHYFEKVMVMVDDIDIKNNRLATLNVLRESFLTIADISLLITD